MFTPGWVFTLNSMVLRNIEACANGPAEPKNVKGELSPNFTFRDEPTSD